MKHKCFNTYLKTLSQNPFVIETKAYFRKDKNIQTLSEEAQKIGHAILIYQDYKALKRHVKEIGHRLII